MDTKKAGSGSKVCFVEAGSPVTLREFSNKNVFPSVLKVYEGNSSLSHSFSFGSDLGHIRIGPVTIPVGVDRLFVALRKKSVEVAHCKDLSNNRYYTVPIGSIDAIELIPEQGFEWQGEDVEVSLRQIVQAKSLPKILCVTKPLQLLVNDGTGNINVPAGSFLFPQKVKKGMLESRLVAKRVDGSTVHITKTECRGRVFSVRLGITNTDTQVTPALAAKCMKLPFACTVKFLDDETSQPFHVNVEEIRTSEVLTAIMKMTEGSIADDIGCNQQEFEIPVDLNFKVTHMVPKDELDGRLHSNPSSVADDSHHEKAIITKRSSSSSVRNSEGKNGSTRKPSNTSKSNTATTTVPSGQPQDDEDEYHTYSSIDSDGEVMYDSAEEGNFYDSADSQSGSYVSFDSDSELSDDIYDVARVRDSIYVSDDVSFWEEEGGNILDLQSLNCDTILNLLDAMDLGRYKTLFKQAKIDGSVFSGFTEDVLSDLGIQIPFHRARLMRVVNGEVSIKRTLKDMQTQGDSHAYENVEWQQPALQDMVEETTISSSRSKVAMEEIYDDSSEPTQAQPIAKTTSPLQVSGANIYSNVPPRSDHSVANCDDHFYDIPPDADVQSTQYSPGPNSVNLKTKQEPRSSLPDKVPESSSTYANVGSLISKFDSFHQHHKK
jgi:hypothetical protein